MEYNSKEILKVALGYLDKAITENPSADLYIQRSKVYKELGDMQHAMQDAMKAIEMDPSIMQGMSGEFETK